MSSPLGDFLVSRRAAIDPATTMLPPTHTPRRVPGLRREEVASLAGVSVAYYIKLEQGRIGQVSEEVLAAVERALQLDDLEGRHLRALVAAAARPDRAPVPIPDVVRPELATMMRALGTAPAMVYNDTFDVLAVNSVAAALLDDFESLPVPQRNLARWTFLNPRAKEVYADWDEIARQVAAAVRHRAARTGPDPVLAQLIGEITMASPDFARFWADHHLYEHSHGAKHFRNDLVGELHLRYETLSLPADGGQELVIYSAAPNSPDEEELRLLASWVTGTPIAGSDALTPAPGTRPARS